MTELENAILHQIITGIADAHGEFRISFDAPTGECWLDIQPGAGADLIADYHGPDEVMIPLLEAAQNVVDRAQR